jgi:hypothetical protein
MSDPPSDDDMIFLPVNVNTKKYECKKDFMIALELYKNSQIMRTSYWNPKVDQRSLQISRSSLGYHNVYVYIQQGSHHPIKYGYYSIDIQHGIDIIIAKARHGGVPIVTVNQQTYSFYENNKCHGRCSLF